MGLYKFFNPFASPADCVIIIKADGYRDAMDIFRSEFLSMDSVIKLSTEIDYNKIVISWGGYDDFSGIVRFFPIFSLTIK